MNEEIKELLIKTKAEIDNIENTGSDLREQLRSLGNQQIADIQKITEIEINSVKQESIDRNGIINDILNSINANDLSTANALLEKLKK